MPEVKVKIKTKLKVPNEELKQILIGRKLGEVSGKPSPANQWSGQ